ncbi:MAG: hypothetical protein ACK6BG_02560 [Cyanobacteriota bacterium]
MILPCQTSLKGHAKVKPIGIRGNVIKLTATLFAHRTDLYPHQSQGLLPLGSDAAGVGEEEAALSYKASSLDSIAASCLFSFRSRSLSFSFSISFVRLARSCLLPLASCLSLSFSFSLLLLLWRTLICASMARCQLNVAKNHYHGGKEIGLSQVNGQVAKSPAQRIMDAMIG